MKLLSKLTVLIILFSSFVLTAQEYGLSNIDKSLFEKYRVPEIKYKSFYLNSGFSYRSNTMNYDSNSTGSDWLNETYNFNLRPVFNYSAESEKSILNLVGTILLNGHSNVNVTDHNDFRYKYHEISYSYQINLRPEYIRYLPNCKFFLRTKLTAEVYIDRDDIKRSNQDGTTADFNKFDNQDYGFEIGFGYGKIRNVTPLVQAARFQNRLMVLNKLNNKFNDETMLALAQQFSKSDAYNTVYDRPDKFFWNDVETVLNNNGVSLDGLNQYGNSYLREVENELKFMRYEGFRISSLVDLSYYKYRRNRTDSWYSNTLEETSLISAGIRLACSKQLNLNSQFRTELLIKGGSFLTNNPRDRQEYSFQGMIGYWYELTDRLVIECQNTFEYYIRNSAKTGYETQNDFRASANYFWEDNISTGLSYNWEYRNYDDYWQYVDHTQSIQSVTFNMLYIFTSNFLIR